MLFVSDAHPLYGGGDGREGLCQANLNKESDKNLSLDLIARAYRPAD